jgi:hypothetical protein
MGWAAKANPRSTDGKTERDATIAQIRDFLTQFTTRERFEAYCDTAHLTASERVYLETLLPAHLTVDVTVES